MYVLADSSFLKLGPAREREREWGGGGERERGREREREREGEKKKEREKERERAESREREREQRAEREREREKGTIHRYIYIVPARVGASIYETTTAWYGNAKGTRNQQPQPQISLEEYE